MVMNMQIDGMVLTKVARSRSFSRRCVDISGPGCRLIEERIAMIPLLSISSTIFQATISAALPSPNLVF